LVKLAYSLSSPHCTPLPACFKGQKILPFLSFSIFLLDSLDPGRPQGPSFCAERQNKRMGVDGMIKSNGWDNYTAIGYLKYALEDYNRIVTQGNNYCRPLTDEEVLKIISCMWYAFDMKTLEEAYNRR